MKAVFNLATGITNTRIRELTALICGYISTASSQHGFWTQGKQIVLLPYKRGTGGRMWSSNYRNGLESEGLHYKQLKGKLTIRKVFFRFYS